MSGVLGLIVAMLELTFARMGSERAALEPVAGLVATLGALVRRPVGHPLRERFKKGADPL